LKRIVSTKDFAVCGGGLHILYLSYQKKFSSSGEPKFVPFKDTVVPYLASMFFRPGSPLLAGFDRIIGRIVHSGMVTKVWQDIRRREIGHKEGDEEEEDDDDDGGSDAVVLTLNHLQGAFILLVLGLAFGLVVFILELIIFTFRNYLTYRLINRTLREFKARSLVSYKRHVIHKTYVRRVQKKTIFGKIKI
jgi:hypothetical protein